MEISVPGLELDPLVIPTPPEPKKETAMSDAPKNYFSTLPNGGDNSMNSLWPLLLLGGRGGFGNGFGDGGYGRGYGDAGGCVTPAMLATSLDGVNNHNAHQSISTALGDIKASIPYNEAQVQLALAGQMSSLTSTMNSNFANQTAQQTANALAASAANTAQSNALAQATATIIANAANTKEAVLTSAALNAQAILQSRYEVSKDITADGDKTRALIIANNDAVLNRELTVAQTALLEARSIGRERDNSMTITQTVNQTQAQAQVQAQQQQQFQLLANLNAAVCNLANDIQVVRQTQSNVNFGTQTGNTTSANASNTRVN